MLVLTRKLEQEIRIGGDIVIKVVGIMGNRVRLGITAPVDVQIERDDAKEGPKEYRYYEPCE